ncbi:DUF6221 family protein [Amycolatopsis sp. NPDC006131]|uniref:DUF6221 family protein n=1 Tax=Amycolatopsis sp. NPDC006131 TaxID=3156731 RepID=UPI0033AF3E39
MSDLVERLLAAITETERVAAAVPDYLAGPWTAGKKEGYLTGDYKVFAASGQEVVGPGYEGGGAFGVEVRDHIALNGPARALRRCAADRKIVELHEPRGVRDVDCGECSDRDYPEPWPCPTLEYLAEGYGITEEDE